MATYINNVLASAGSRPPRQPEQVMMKILLLSTQAFFESPDILPERTMGVVLNAGKRMLERSQRSAEVRYEMTFSLELL